MPALVLVQKGAPHPETGRRGKKGREEVLQHAGMSAQLADGVVPAEKLSLNPALLGYFMDDIVDGIESEDNDCNSKGIDGRDNAFCDPQKFGIEPVIRSDRLVKNPG